MNREKVALLIAIFWPYRVTLLALLLVMIVKAGLEALFALLLVPLFDYLLGVQSVESISKLVLEFIGIFQSWLGIEDVLRLSFLLLVGLSIATIITGLLFSYLHYYALVAFERDKRNELFGKLLQVDWLYYLDQRAGHILNTMTVEVIKSRKLFGNLIRLTDASIAACLYIATAAYISPNYILLVMFMLMGLALIMLPLLRRIRRLGNQAIKVNQRLMQQLNEFVGGFKVIKSSGMEMVARQLVEQQSIQLARLGLYGGLLKSVPSSTLEPMVLIVVVGLIYFMRSYEIGQISELAVVSLILLRTFQRVARLQQQSTSIAEVWASFALISQLPFTLDKHREPSPVGIVERFETLEFCNLSFAYQKDQPVLQNLNLTIKRGEFIGIIGSSGAGKSTLVDLILGLLKPTAGQLLVNQKPLSQVNPHHWRDLIGYVPQETILFNETIVENVTLQRNDITQEQLLWAAQMANADEFIRALPQAYQTVVGDRGAKISGGQRQRLALARALVRQPQLLLLDEATSALDSLSEQKIQQAVESLRNKLTIVVVAHRLSTVMNADRIIVLDRGQIVEMGHPQELIAVNGRFREMYALQTTQGLN